MLLLCGMWLRVFDVLKLFLARLCFIFSSHRQTLVMPSGECGATNHIQNEKQAIPHERSGTNRQPQMEAWRPITLNVEMTIVWNMELQMDAAGEMSAATNESRSRVTQCLRTRRKSQEWFSSRLVRFSI